MPFIAFIFAVFLFIYAELSLLVWVGAHLGVIMLIVLLVLSSLAGVALIRARGWYILTQAQKQLLQGELPTETLLKSAAWLIAGVLLLVPGFLTDILALLLLSPLGSAVIKRFIAGRVLFARKNIFKNDRTFYDGGSDIFEAEYEKETDEPKRLK